MGRTLLNWLLLEWLGEVSYHDWPLIHVARSNPSRASDDALDWPARLAAASQLRTVRSCALPG